MRKRFTKFAVLSLVAGRNIHISSNTDEAEVMIGFLLGKEITWEELDHHELQRAREILFAQKPQLDLTLGHMARLHTLLIEGFDRVTNPTDQHYFLIGWVVRASTDRNLGEWITLEQPRIPKKHTHHS